MIADQVRVAVSLLAAHLVADFVLRSDRDVQSKHRWRVLIRHAFIVAALSYLLCGLWRAWLIPVAVFATHLAFDLTKARLARPGRLPVALDQAAHLLVIVALSLLLGGGIGARGLTFWLSSLGKGYYAGLILVAGGRRNRPGRPRDRRIRCSAVP